MDLYRVVLGSLYKCIVCVSLLLWSDGTTCKCLLEQVDEPLQMQDVHHQVLYPFLLEKQVSSPEVFWTKSQRSAVWLNEFCK